MSMMFPCDLARLVAEYAARWTILPWVQKLNLLSGCNEKCEQMCQRPRNERFIYSCMYAVMKEYLLRNPRAEYAIKVGIDASDFYWLSSNTGDWALDMLEAHPNFICYNSFSRNSNKRALAHLAAHPEKVDINGLIQNPGLNAELVSLVRAVICPDEHGQIQRNISDMLSRGVSEEAKALMDEFKVIPNPYIVASNPAPWAIKILQEQYDMKYSMYFSHNPHPWVIEQIENIPLPKLHWFDLSRNPGAIDILRAHPHIIQASIYENPAIFEPIVPDGLEDAILAIRF